MIRHASVHVRPPGLVRRVSVFLAAGGPQNAREEDNRDHGDDEEGCVKVHCASSLPVEYQKPPGHSQPPAYNGLSRFLSLAVEYARSPHWNVDA